MNLFILSLCFRECAEWMFDKHISKMIVEAVQMLSTAKRVLGPSEADSEEIKIYKISHKNHPVSIWIRTSLENYLWTLDMVDAMHEEWRFRYGHPETKLHASYKIAQYLRRAAPSASQFPEKGLTPFAQAMPVEYKDEDAVEAYRRYYQSPDKRRIASWKKRTAPHWYVMEDA
jgi:hypothetical protein